MSEELGRLENELSLLEQERRELRVKIGNLSDEINAKTMEIFRIRFGIFVGCVVVDSENNEYQVIKITQFLGRPKLEGNPLKKDGTWSKLSRTVWREWKVKE
jgi:hypothetical protein